MKPELSNRPRLALGCRLSEENRQPRVLHMPERALRLNATSLQIIERCDGEHTVQQIILELQDLYSKALRQKVEDEILIYLELLHNSRAIDFISDEIARGRAK